uniref:Uncharacterized protein n=1 Tax=Rhizophora mucronata TaxID=61149 RepID=A0A2P2J0I9_RHIMU
MPPTASKPEFGRSLCSLLAGFHRANTPETVGFNSCMKRT